MQQKRLHIAKTRKKDEFYTQLHDIERECMRYKDYFKDKTIFLNCDDPLESNFWKYFALNFTHFGLKKLVATHFEQAKPSYKLELTGDMDVNGVINDDDVVKYPLKQNGDFRSPECIEIMKAADIIITNPPFSLFREYVAQLMEYEKKFLIIGNQNAVTYKEVFKPWKENKIWFGHSIHSGDREFIVPNHYSEYHRMDENGIKYVRVSGVRWFTNLDYKERHDSIALYKRYNPEEYPKYDNFDAININKTVDIPMDYSGPMGVPITFLDKYNPDQFEILGNLGSYAPDGYSLAGAIYIDGKKVFKRILIRNKELL